MAALSNGHYQSPTCTRQCKLFSASIQLLSVPSNEAEATRPCTCIHEFSQIQSIPCIEYSEPIEMCI